MLLARLVSALIAIAIILIVLFVLPAAYIAPVILVVIGAGAWEWSALARIRSAPLRIGYVTFILALAIVYWLAGDPAWLTAVLVVAGLWWLFAFIVVLRYPVKIAPALVWVAGPITLVSMFAALDALARFGFGEHFPGPVLLLFVLAAIWAADVGGYFAGRHFGGAKLAPKVSPKKTWAGVFGGLALSGVVGVAGDLLFGIGWYRIVPLCLMTAAISVLGDLIVSVFKREAGLKDSGKLFPGHGGILDRVDSISAGSVLFTAGLVLGHGAW